MSEGSLSLFFMLTGRGNKRPRIIEWGIFIFFGVTLNKKAQEIFYFARSSSVFALPL